MKEYILLMLDDSPDRSIADDPARWTSYLARLREGGRFDGGSAIGNGERVRKGHPVLPAALALDGFIQVRADDIDDARRFLVGNPVHDAGGTVEISELRRD